MPDLCSNEHELNPNTPPLDLPPDLPPDLISALKSRHFPTTFPPVSTPGFIIGFSGGKDSLCLMEMAIELRTLYHPSLLIRPFIMSFLPGMDYTQHWIEYARKRWSVEVLEYQHWGTMQYLRRGIFRHEAQPDKWPNLKINDIEDAVRSDTGLSWIGYGYKSIDSLQRRGMISSWKRIPGSDGYSNPTRRIFAPMRDFNHTDIKRYLSRHHIPLPPATARVSGINLSPSCMYLLRRDWPNDYRRILEVFPYAGMQADRHIPTT